jgi:hypothetical protein
MGLLYKKKKYQQMFQKSNVIPTSGAREAVNRDITYNDNIDFNPNMLTSEYQKNKNVYDNEVVTNDSRNWLEKRADDDAEWGNQDFDNWFLNIMGGMGSWGSEFVSDTSKTFTGGNKTTSKRKDLNNAVENNKTSTHIDAAKHVATEIALAYAGEKALSMASPYVKSAFGRAFKQLKRLAPEQLKSISLKLSKPASYDTFKSIRQTPEGFNKELKFSIIPKNETENATRYAIDKGNYWSEDWYNSPEFFKRLKRFEGDPIEDANYVLGQVGDVHRPSVAKYLNKYQRGRPFTEMIKDRINNKMYISRAANKAEHAASSENLAGVSNYRQPITGPENLVYKDRLLRDSSREGAKDVLLEQILSTSVHEGNHGVTNGLLHLPKKLGNLLSSLLGDTKSTVFKSPEEIYARIQQVRQGFGIKPGQRLYENQAKYMLDMIKAGKTALDPAFGNAIVDARTFANILNRVPAVTAISTGLYNMQEPKQNAESNKNGGILYKK